MSIQKQVPVFTEAQLAGSLFDFLGRLTTTCPFDTMEAPIFLDILEDWATERELTLDEAEVETWNLKFPDTKKQGGE